jgi:hypothetical protein
MTTRIVTLYTMTRAEAEADPTRCGVNMPLGAQVCQVGSQGNKVFITALVDPARPIVWHPMRVVPLNESFKTLIGNDIGECFGVATVPNGRDFLMLHVFQELPWPKLLMN